MRTTDPEHLDVLIVGAGLSGIGAACHLSRRCPDHTYAILEARERIGGTWDLFRYPGVRSDSDMHTLGYVFSPWEDDRALADGPSILRYITDTAARHGVPERIRTGQRVTDAQWSDTTSRWTVTVQRAGEPEPATMTCSFLLMCGGYYDYEQGYTPDFTGIEQFRGQIIHPQHWPENLEYDGKRVVVIGSGATAITLVPAMAQRAEHVTMLQRSPTYVVSLPGEDGIAKWLRRRLPAKLAYHLVRWKNVGLMTLSYQLSRRRPGLMRAIIRRGAERQLPDGFDVDTHFKPSYDPWDQRLCVVPDGDLFTAVREGTASIVTDRVQTFTERGVRLESGGELEADIVVTATGLRLLALGGVNLSVDGRPISVPDTFAYRAMMLSGVPNFAFTVGYTNASWTLKADLTAEYVCRLLTHMSQHGYTRCAPETGGARLTPRPLIDLASGYVQRSLQEFPAQGPDRPWRVRQNYPLDLLEFRRADVEDGVMRFSRTGEGGAAATDGIAPAAAASAA
ncbi:MAG: NAD(P)/FAD-dependent oxidoreductase [Solirubrobacteraceae bacterium]